MLHFFHRYELPRVERQHRSITRVTPVMIGEHQLVAVLHAPMRPFHPRISLAVFTSNNHEDEDISDNDGDDTASATVSSSNSSTMTDSIGSIRNRFYQNSDTLLRRPLQ